MCAALVTLKRRPEFLRVRGGARWATAAFVIEAKPRPDPGPEPVPRFGFTVTKQLGGAVIRNRIRRRLRAAISAAGVPRARSGVDYVVIARPAAETMPFVELIALVKAAMAKVDAPRRAGETKTKRT